MNNNPKRRRPSARHNQTSSMKEDKKTKELIDNLIACFRSSTQSTVPFPTRPAPPPPSSQRKPLSDIAPTSFHDSRNEHVASRGTAKVGSKGSRAGTRLWRALQTSATRVIAQSVDFQNLSTIPYDGSFLDPSLLQQACQHPDGQYHIWAATEYVLKESDGLDIDQLVAMVMERYVVELGAALMDHVEGPHFTFVDPRLYSDTSAMVAQARRLITLFESKDVDRGRIIVSIPATEAGILAAKQLENQHSVQTNLINVFGLIHAQMCSAAGATCLTFAEMPANRPGSNSAQAKIRALDVASALTTIQMTAAYFEMHQLRTRLMATNLELNVVQGLQGIDFVTFTASDLEAAKTSTLPLFPPPGENSPVRFRARIAQCPSKITSEKMFFSRLSSETHPMAQATSLRCLLLGMVRQQVRDLLEQRMKINSLDDVELVTMYLKDVEEYTREYLAEESDMPQEPRRKRAPRRNHVGFRLFFSDWDCHEWTNRDHQSYDSLDENFGSRAVTDTGHNDADVPGDASYDRSACASRET
ncbi:hypothetical protein AcV5_009562 [Taiwanofungus camphoratus]|nr:hypothetical protein AcV5_009562 [Antrodia cinnamomea]